MLATGRWLCLPLPTTLWYGVPPPSPQLYGTVVYGGPSWEPTAPIIGAPGLHAGFFAFAPPLNYLSFRVVLRFGGKPGSLWSGLQASNRATLPCALTSLQSSSGESSRIVLKEIILWQFFPRHGWSHTCGWVDQAACWLLVILNWSALLWKPQFIGDRTSLLPIFKS